MSEEEFKVALGDLLDRQGWFPLFCANAVNEVTESHDVFGFTFIFHRDEYLNRTVILHPDEILTCPEEELIASHFLRILDEIISERTTQ